MWRFVFGNARGLWLFGEYLGGVYGFFVLEFCVGFGLVGVAFFLLLVLLWDLAAFCVLGVLCVLVDATSVGGWVAPAVSSFLLLF